VDDTSLFALSIRVPLLYLSICWVLMRWSLLKSDWWKWISSKVVVEEREEEWISDDDDDEDERESLRFFHFEVVEGLLASRQILCF